MLDKDSVKQQVLLSIREFCQAYLPSGYTPDDKKWVCADYTGLERGQSFQMEMTGSKAGLWYDHAEGEGGDIFTLVERQKKCSFTDAVNELAEFSGYSESPDERTVMPVPHDRDISVDSIVHNSLGKPTAVYPYKDIDGNLLFFVCRFEPQREKKQILPYCLTLSDGKMSWQWRGVKGLIHRPIYKAELIKSKENILIVEGEKAADMANENLPADWCAVTWMGGTSTVGKVDWSILKNKTVVAWPDNDEPGRKAMDFVVGKLECKLLRVPVEKFDGWDAADYITETERPSIIDFIRENTMDSGDPFQVLGSDGKRYHYFTSAKRIVSITVAEHSRKVTLFELAPRAWWFKTFPKMNKSGEVVDINVDQAADYLLSKSNSMPIFEFSNVRGRGVHVDNKKVIVNCGSSFYVNGEQKDLSVLNNTTKRTYIPKPGISNPFDVKPMSVNEAALVQKALSMFPFKDRAMEMFVGGWIAMAPVSNVLKWRPHMWVTGSRSSTKSSLYDKLVAPCLGDWVCKVASQLTTEASIRNALENDVLPVIYDESESNSVSGKLRFESILDLVRQSSGDVEDAYIMKATQNHDVKKYFIRSMFSFFSITCAINKPEDFSRFALVEMDQNMIKHDYQNEVMPALEPMQAKDFAQRFISLQVNRIELMQKNVQKFWAPIAGLGFGTRMADQYAPLLAGYTMLGKDQVSDDDVKRAMDQVNFEQINQDQSDMIEDRIMNTFMGEQIRVEFYKENMSVAEIWLKAKDPSWNAILKRNGMARLDDAFVIAINHNWPKSVANRHDLPINWGRILRSSWYAKKQFSDRRQHRFNGFLETAIFLDPPMRGNIEADVVPIRGMKYNA